MAERQYTAMTIEDIWVPGQSLDHVYPIPSVGELSAELQKGLPGDYVEMGEVFGSMRVPAADERIDSVVSLDLCEVMRLTARAIAATGGKDHDGNNYIEGLWQDERFESAFESEHAYYTIQPIAQVMINHGYVEPVSGAGEIVDIIRRWRQDGTYCIANTSTLPGCELGTVRFLNEYFPGCFDGIVFPRNHDGTSKITKADALGHVIARLEEKNQSPQYAMHIDDTVHHIQSMIDQKPHASLYCFLPVYPGCLALDALSAEVRRANTPLEAFRQMEDLTSELRKEKMQ